MKIATINVNGLDSRKNTLIQYMNQNNLDIYCLQETHKISLQNFNYIEKNTNTLGFISTASKVENDYRGVAVLIGRSLQQFKIQNLNIDIPSLKHRMMHISILAEEEINIINVYAPAKNIEKSNFYEDVKKYLTKFKNKQIILLGDFNYVENINDRVFGFDYADRKVNKIFSPKELNLIDTFSNVHNTLDFTHLRSRIDRIYVSKILYPKILKIQHTTKIADHKTVLLEINLDKFKPWGRYYWKFNNSLLTNAIFKQEILDLILNYHETKMLNEPHQNWESFKNQVKIISKKFGNFLSALRKNEVIACQNLKNQNPTEEILRDIEEKEKEIKNFQNLGNLIRSKNKILDKIYSEGKSINRKEEFEKGTSKFIFKIKANNKEYNEKEDILREIQSFYQNLYSSQNIPNAQIQDYLQDFNPPLLDSTQKDSIGAFIKEEEVDLVIRNLNLNKSPGLDGITAEFYQEFRPQLVPILTELYNNSLLQGYLPKNFKQSIITLIFKNKGSPDEIKNWRPISLLNLDYKILTKTLTLRLKNTIANIINEFQSCGPNRSIINNALNLKSIIKYIRQNDQKYAIISLDQEKAFDRIEHNFLKIVLQKYDFPPNFIKWFEILYTDIESKILVNGTFTSTFKIMRSVRQGCPLSMFLYALGLEPLIFKINQNPQILGIKIPNMKNQIKSFQHADDTTVIIRDQKSYYSLKNETKNFSKASGSKINDEKTEILTFGDWENLKLETSKSIFKEKIKVYGVFFGANENKENYLPRIQKIKQTINKWNKIYFNLFEKVIILKTYIFSILQYTMIFSEIPIIYINEINTLIFNFLWNGKDKIKRETLHQDFSKGGLNVPSLMQKQDSLIIQTLRRIEINRNQPWANLYIYWFGINLKFYCSEYASNNYLHNIENFEENQNIKNVILKYRINEAVWKTNNLKLIYKIIIDSLNITTTIAFKYPISNWDLIWNNISQFRNPKERLILFKFMHKVLPTGDYYHKIKILKNIPHCADCWLGQNSQKHIFESCTHHKDKRNKLISDLKNIEPNININSTLIQTGSNDKNLPLHIQNKIIKLILNFILLVWEDSTKLKVKR